MVVASFVVLAFIRFAASPSVFKGCDCEPVFLSLPVLALICISSAEAIRADIDIINNKHDCLIITFLLKSYWKLSASKENLSLTSR